LELTKSNKKVIEPVLDKSISQELIDKLEKLLHEKEVFIDPNLTLEKLSKILNSNRTYLSENINLHYKVSFSSLIKSFRIKKAREMLIDKNFSYYSIEGIATSVGYKSISSFNSSFKKETGITPSYFRKNA
jgi:YesN/AraC family two-component response regulator